jgi:hypothetical protein
MAECTKTVHINLNRHKQIGGNMKRFAGTRLNKIDSDNILNMILFAKYLRAEINDHFSGSDKNYISSMDAMEEREEINALPHQEVVSNLGKYCYLKAKLNSPTKLTAQQLIRCALEYATQDSDIKLYLRSKYRQIQAYLDAGVDTTEIEQRLRNSFKDIMQRNLQASISSLEQIEEMAQHPKYERNLAYITAVQICHFTTIQLFLNDQTHFHPELYVLKVRVRANQAICLNRLKEMPHPDGPSFEECAQDLFFSCTARKQEPAPQPDTKRLKLLGLDEINASVENFNR